MPSIFTSPGCPWILGGALGFVAENALLSENREWIIQKIGRNSYHNVFGLLSSITTASVIYGFMKYRHAGPLRFPTPIPLWRHAAAFMFQWAGLHLLLQLVPTIQNPITTSPPPPPRTRAHSEEAVLADPSLHSKAEAAPSKGFRLRCPFDFSPRSGDAALTTEANTTNTVTDKAALGSTTATTTTTPPATPIAGVHRITRHPMLVGFACVGLSAFFASPRPQVAALGLAPLVVAVFGAAHMDSRHRRGLGGVLTPDQEAASSHLPLLAVVTGRQKWADVVQDTKATNASLAFVGALVMAFARARRLGM